jgi:PAS domain S-box-containing protein
MYVDINEGFTKILGYSREDAIGKTSLSLNIWKNPEDRKRLVDELAGKGCAENLIAEFVGKDGNIRIGMMSARIFELGNENVILSVTRDISKLKQAEDALRRSEEKFRQIYENILDIYYEASLEGIILEISPSIEKISHYKREELIGKSLYEIYANPADRDRLVEILLDKGSVRDYEILLSDKDGSQHLCSMNIELIKDNAHQPEKIVGICRDISVHKQAENEKLEAQKIAAEHEKLAVVGQVAGKMAHDFNNVLGNIMGNTELSLLDCKEPETKKTLELIYKQTLRGRNLTKNLVAFAKDQEPRQELFRIKDKITLVLDLLKKDLEGIELIQEDAPDVPEVIADPGMIEHALINLIQNAIHATSRTEHPEIIVRTYCFDGNICFEIQDNGCGIPEKYLPRIYDPSFTLKGNRDTTGSYEASIKGTGYGMANVKKYIEQHRGHVSVETAFGSGTKFTIGLPIMKKEYSDKGKKELLRSKLHSDKDILIVEDEPAISAIQYQILTKAPCNHRADIAHNGEIAVKLLAEKRYDFISLDYSLPGNISGMEVYHHIRKTDKTVPILFVSGNIEFLESIKNLKQNDPHVDHLSKPCMNIDYLNSINTLLGRHRN